MFCFLFKHCIFFCFPIIMGKIFENSFSALIVSTQHRSQLSRSVCLSAFKMLFFRNTKNLFKRRKILALFFWQKKKKRRKIVIIVVLLGLLCIVWQFVDNFGILFVFCSNDEQYENWKICWKYGEDDLIELQVK